MKKKILILGANPETIPIVIKAKEMGLHVIVVDPNPKSPAKEYSDESYDINGLDTDALIQLGQKLEIDAVIVGVADILIKPYVNIATTLGLFTYGKEEFVHFLTDKGKFSEALIEYELNPIPTFDPDFVNEISMDSFPLLVKPPDSGGGVGMTICKNKEMLESAIKLATSQSISKSFLIEKFMDCDDMGAYFTIKDGEVYLSTIADRFTTKLQGSSSPVCIGARYPSIHTGEFIKKVLPKIRLMLQGIGVENGILNIQFFYDGENFYAYDPGFRLQGEGSHYLMSAINNIDHIEMLINFAMTGNLHIDPSRLENSFRLKGLLAASVWVLLKKGTVKDIFGLDSIKSKDYVLRVIQRFYIGDEVLDTMIGNEKQVFARIYIKANNKDQLKDNIRYIRENLKIIDENKNNMILDLLHEDLM